MQSPFVIGLLSIIPGLGFFLLGKPRRGFWVIGILLALFLLFLFTASEFVAQVSFQFFILVYLGQIILAARGARLQKRQEAGEVTQPREKEKIVPPPDLTFRERGAYKIRETVRQQLNAGENLHEAVVALSTRGYSFSTKQYYMGLTDEALVMIEQDSFGKHADIKRIPLSTIKSTEMKKKIVYDSWVMDLGEKKPLKLYVTSGLRHLSTEINKKLQELIS